MNIQIIKPSSFLSQFIKHYWILSTRKSESEVCERVIPISNVELMFHYGNPFVVKTGEKSVSQFRSFVCGINSSYADVATCGESGVISVTFYPFGACNFFNFPLLEVENKSINLHDIYNRRVADFEERICKESQMSEKIRLVEQFLMKNFTPVSTEDFRMIKEAVSITNRFGGRITASELSQKLFLNGKTLERKFSSLIGKTPKQFLRIARFEHVIKSFLDSPCPSLTNFTYENGYFDQAHFIKDFKSLCGYTPGEFLQLCPCRSNNPEDQNV